MLNPVTTSSVTTSTSAIASSCGTARPVTLARPHATGARVARMSAGMRSAWSTWAICVSPSDSALPQPLRVIAPLVPHCRVLVLPVHGVPVAPTSRTKHVSAEELPRDAVPVSEANRDTIRPVATATPGTNGQ
jgi:hypothetical protein